MTSTRRSGRCWACGEEHLASDDPPEHIVQAALGGTLTTDRFAADCNRELGRSVDQPFLRDFWVAAARARYDIRDPRRADRPPPIPSHTAHFPDGRPARIDMLDGKWEPIPLPHVQEDDNKFIITASSFAEAERATSKKVSRLKRDGQKIESEPVMRWQKVENPEVQVDISMSATIRVRAAAKVALGVLSLVLPDDWLDSEGAKQLQGWMWDDWPKNAEGQKIIAPPRRVPEPLSTICRPPEHLLFFSRGRGDELIFTAILLGEQMLPIRTNLAGAPRPTMAWTLDPKAHSCKETTFDDLLLRAVEALA